jgi:tripartite ATP-independent transporter DctP family solute receptor
MKRRHFVKFGLGFGAAGLANLAGLPAARAQAKTVFKAADVQPPGYPTVVATENFGKKLEAATNGRLSVRVYPSMQLGGEKETAEQTRAGAIQLLRISAGVIGSIVDDVNVVNMPFLFRDTAHAEQMMDGPIGQELLDKITANADAGLVALCWMSAGARSLYNSKKPIKSIGDIKGMKFRVLGNPIFIEMVNALGGTGVAMSYDQVLGALQSGKIDGAENNPPSYVFSNHYTAAKYYSLTEHLIIPELLVFSSKAWATLSADDQALIKKLAREAQFEERKLWTQFEQDALAKVKAAGCMINEISDKGPFQKAANPVWKKYGPKYQDMINRILAMT